MIVWVIAGLLGLATGLRIGWALVNKQSLVSAAMILALGSLGTVAALNWQPLTLLIDSLLRWPNVSMVFSQVALIACAAGSCVMITSASSSRKPAQIRRIAIVQYSVALVIAALSLLTFFTSPQQPEMAPEEYLRRNLGAGGTGMSWLLPLLYVLLALTLVAWAGVRHSNRTRRGRALFLFTLGIALIVLASAFFLLRAVGNTRFVGVGSAATLLGCAMLVVAGGSLLPSIEDWFGARRELKTIQPLLSELSVRHPNIGIGVRPRGPLLFRVAEQMSLISDALYLEATEVLEDGQANETPMRGAYDDVDPETASPELQARRVAEWIHDGRGASRESANSKFPGPTWLRQPSGYSDREWILAIADEYRKLDQAVGVAAQ
ncbi:MULTISPECIES: hypothetical protein [unclassified Mycolicibacterium]|uniref:hypothetical protein n=1 Tax=unclassified Mycolicibacterium TaxID=2636767 RepID=UPI001F4BEF53|nr:hypothetical protein [Mycolicibacterium sp. YH-1]UNB53061.1 hypothetical protein L0M16_01375 [Mycolicibacterium sp. YH-1]